MCPGCENSIRLVVGMGNPGRAYERNRHNAGFMLVDLLAARISGRKQTRNIGNYSLTSGRLAGTNVFLMKPLTFMNLSGEAVVAFARSEEISSDEFVLAYDDMDIPLGKLRISQGGGSAGHNGVESVIQETGTSNFARMRLGIGSECEIVDRKDFVLSDFSESEMKMFQSTLEMAFEATVLILKRGIGKAMNDFNGRDAVDFMESRNKNKEKI